MKKMFSILAVLTIFAVSANAQSSFKKSDVILEGTASYSKTEGLDATYSIAPSIGYFLTDKFAIGIIGETAKDDAGVKTNAIGVFGRCYVLNIGKNLKTYSQLTMSSLSVNDDASKTSAFGVNLGLGLNYFVSPKLALTLNVADLVDYSNVESTSTFSIGWQGVTNPFSATKFGVLYRF
jgi:outer membrane protein